MKYCNSSIPATDEFRDPLPVGHPTAISAVGGGTELPSEMMMFGLGERLVVVETTLLVRNSSVQFAAPLTSIPEKNG